MTGLLLHLQARPLMPMIKFLFLLPMAKMLNKSSKLEFLVMYGMQLLMFALFIVTPITLLLCLATDTVQSENTWLSFVAVSMADTNWARRDLLLLRRWRTTTNWCSFV